MRNELTAALENRQEAFDLKLTAGQIARLADYYEIVRRNNEPLHLVAPGSAEDFAVRHILESLTLLEFLPENSAFADVGTGAGLPSIPCLIAREDLRAFLVESKLKKANYLKEALDELKLSARAEIINRQFEEIEKPSEAAFVACRALDKFTQKLPKLLRWSRESGLLFFGGPSLHGELVKNKVRFSEKLMPLSEQRFLFYAGKI